MRMTHFSIEADVKYCTLLYLALISYNFHFVEMISCFLVEQAHVKQHRKAVLKLLSSLRRKLQHAEKVNCTLVYMVRHNLN